MSLVEQAAKRLQEIGQTHKREAFDPVATPRESAAASLIERAVGKPETQDASRASSIDAASQVRQLETVRHATRVDINLPKLAAAGYLEPDDPESLMANEFRKIKRPLIQACQGKLTAPVANANRIMVTSSVPGEGKTFVAMNLALSIAMERDSTVLLIDADTTRRSLSRLLGLTSNPGILDLLGSHDVGVADTLLRTNVERLRLLPSGQPRRNATEMLASEAMERLVEELASRYSDRILIFDTPPLLGAPEPAVLATHMGQIIVVVEAEKTTQRVLTNALAAVESCPVVMAVLNKSSTAQGGYYYYAS